MLVRREREKIKEKIEEIVGRIQESNEMITELHIQTDAIIERRQWRENDDGATTVAFRANNVDGGEEDNKSYHLNPGQHFIPGGTHL